MVFKTILSFIYGLYRFYPVLPMGKTDCFTQFYPILPNWFYPLGKTTMPTLIIWGLRDEGERTNERDVVHCINYGSSSTSYNTVSSGLDTVVERLTNKNVLPVIQYYKQKGAPQCRPVMTLNSMNRI